MAVTMAKSKNKTNEQVLSALLKDLKHIHPIYSALLRERILCICEQTLIDIDNNPENWKNPFIHPNCYRELNEIVQRNIGFEK